MDAERHILETLRTWAVVGISNRPDRPGFYVPMFLRARGYRIVPVNPALSTWQGETAYPDLASIPFPIDVVDLFRRPEFVADHVNEAIRIGAKVVWMQLGVAHAEAARNAREAGLLVVEDRCPILSTRRFWPGDDGPRFQAGR